METAVDKQSASQYTYMGKERYDCVRGKAVRVIRCPTCREPVPWNSQYCARCDVSAYSSTRPAQDGDTTIRFPRRNQRPRSLRVPTFFAMKTGDPDETLHRERAQPKTPPSTYAKSVSSTCTDETIDPMHNIEEWLEEAEFTDDGQRRATWQKVVTRKTPALSTLPSVSSIPVRDHVKQEMPGAASPDTPLSLPGKISRPPYKPFAPVLPRIGAWGGIVALLALLLGGSFGIFAALGRGAQHTSSPVIFSLQASPSTIATGGVVTLRGTRFTPNGRVGLTRDDNIPIVDSGDAHIIYAGADGSFRDTIIIDGSWQSGAHTLHAEDAALHKTASFTIIVTGHSDSLRPAHLLLSASSIDFGADDQTANSIQTLTLLNGGGGQIRWQSTATRPWLLLSPQNGAFSSGEPMQLTLAVDRSNLAVGAYAAQIMFTSNAGQVTLPIKMRVVPLLPQHEAVLQLTPAVFSFSGIDGGATPIPQVVTMSNPGLRPLNWSASVATGDGENWLAIMPTAGNILKGGSQAITLRVNSGMLLPGVYYGSVTFASQGTEAVGHSPQTIYVSLTVVPQCAIQVMPGALTFTGVYLQSAPAARSISVGVTQGCSAPLQWSVTASTNSGSHWLSISAARGVTPASPSVGITIAGLTPGTYNGLLTFSSQAGTQTVPVTFVMGQPTTPILGSTPALIHVSAVLGQSSPTAPGITIANTGGGRMTWSASAATSVGGAWLGISATSGSLSAHGSTPIGVSVMLLSSLTPGTYNGAITLTANDGAGHAAAGSPQTIPVIFVVQAPCAISTPAPALNFQGVTGQPLPTTQTIPITAAGACTSALNWTASVTTNPSGAWLVTTPASGTVSLGTPAQTSVGIAGTNLAPGTYNGTISITATDSVTHQAVGAPQSVAITLILQPPCTLQAPTSAALNFSNEAGLNPGTQSFTVGVTGACSGNVTITPTATTASGGSWLSVSPPSASLASNGVATFTVAVTSATLAAAAYSGSISLAAVNSSGITFTGSPQVVNVGLTVLSPPALTTTPSVLAFNLATGASSQSITIGNSGGAALNWSAVLDSGAPAFVSIASASSGSTLAGGAAVALSISVDATGLPGGSSYSTGVTISATDALTGNIVAGSPVTIPITITIAAPAMRLSATGLSFITAAGTNPSAQSITITNTGGDGLNWSAGTPSQSWLSVAPGSGSDSSGGTSTPSFNIDVTGLAAGTYFATVDITPAGGSAQTVTVTLTVN